MDQRLLLLLAPLVVLELGLRVAAMVSLSRRQHVRGPKALWAVVVLLVNFGWLVYFLVGRTEEDGTERQA